MGGLGLSLFERLQQAGIQPMLLDTQYRMHPAIAEFPSAAFYRSRLKSSPRPADRPAPQGPPPHSHVSSRSCASFLYIPKPLNMHILGGQKLLSTRRGWPRRCDVQVFQLISITGPQA